LHSVLPIPCHSHNDEWRHTPLHAALGTGCISIEVDVFASFDPDVNELYISHDRSTLQLDRTLHNMYFGPLIATLETMNSPDAATKELSPQDMLQSDPAQQPNGVFALSPTTPLILLLDFKSPPSSIFPVLQEAIAPLAARNYLTRWDPPTQSRVERPITLVASGQADFDTILRSGGNTTPSDPLSVERFVFFDAPLDALIQKGDPDSDQDEMLENHTERENVSSIYRYTYNPSNSHMASASLSRAVGAISPLLTSPDSLQRRLIRDQIKSARRRGLLSRYWDTPRWPKGLRDRVWESLEKEGVGLLNVDDLRAVRKEGWGGRAGRLWWGKRWRGLGGGKEAMWMPEY
jgi:hypothetical protein